MRGPPAAMEAYCIGDGGDVLSAVACDAPDARHALLIVPPWFQDLHRSYRLFARLSERLARRGVSTLRFDYAGTGDSATRARYPSPPSMAADTARAWESLAARSGRRPALLGIRGGAWPAAQCAVERRVPAFAWQPPASGVAYLDDLRAATLAALNDPSRFPFLRGHCRPEPDECMGHRVATGFDEALAALDAPAPLAGRLEASPRPDHHAGRWHALDPTIAAWVGEIDITAPFPTPPIEAAASVIATWLDEAAP